MHLEHTVSLFYKDFKHDSSLPQRVLNTCAKWLYTPHQDRVPGLYIERIHFPAGNWNHPTRASWDDLGVASFFSFSSSWCFKLWRSYNLPGRFHIKHKMLPPSELFRGQLKAGSVQMLPQKPPKKVTFFSSIQILKSIPFSWAQAPLGSPFKYIPVNGRQQHLTKRWSLHIEEYESHIWSRHLYTSFFSP